MINFKKKEEKKNNLKAVGYATGLALTTGGLGVAGFMAKKALENVGPVKVKSFVRKGKRVRSHIRK